MSTPLRALEAAALLLPPSERAKLAERLLASIDNEDQDAEIEAAWAAEIERRVKAFEAGEYEEIPAEQAFAEIRARLAE